MTIQKRLLGYAATLLLLSAGTSFAAHPLISDDASTLGKGNMQIELNGDISTDKERAGSSTTKTTGRQVATSFSIGVTDKIDLLAGFTRPWSNGDVDGAALSDSGSADFSLTLKWQIYEQAGFSVAVKPLFGYSYTIGTADDHAVSYGAAVVLSKEFKPFSTHLNIDYLHNAYNLAATKNANHSDIWSACLGTTYEIDKSMRLVSDFGIAANEDKASHDMPTFALLGAIYALNKSIDLSIGIKAGLTKPETDLTGTFGATLKF